MFFIRSQSFFRQSVYTWPDVPPVSLRFVDALFWLYIYMFVCDIQKDSFQLNLTNFILSMGACIFSCCKSQGSENESPNEKERENERIYGE